MSASSIPIFAGKRAVVKALLSRTALHVAHGAEAVVQTTGLKYHVYEASWNGGTYAKICWVCNALLRGEPLSNAPLGNSSRHTHSTSVELLQDSAEKCALCLLMLKTTQESTGKISINDEGPNNESNTAGLGRSAYGRGERWYTVGDSGRKTYFSFFKEDGPFLVPQRINQYAKHWDQSPIQQSGLSFTIAQAWLKQCLHHEQCRRANRQKLPTRVLDIGTDSDPVETPTRLIITKGLADKYIALSYCWGGPQKLILTRETLPEFVKGISWSQMPLLFQEVIRVCRALEVRYLWIDALCIIQPISDGGEDWVIEGSKMKSVYSGSYLTISASAAYSPRDGLYGWRTDRFVRVRKLDSTREEPFCIGASPHVRDETAGKPWKSLIENTPVRKPWHEHLERLPISARAWTLQERFLAPAVLHFDQDSACWECRTGIYDGQSGSRELHHEVTPDVKLIMPWEYLSGNSDPLQRWFELIENFTRRGITSVDDRLIAFGGLAESFSQTHGSAYYAGLLQKYFHRGLLWMRAYSGEPLQASKVPSWSWARPGLPIDYPGKRWDMLPIIRNQRLEILQVHVRAPEGPFGTIQEGIVMVEGLLEQSVWQEDDSLQGYGGLKWDFSLDRSVDTGDLSLLLVGSWEPGSGKSQTFALVLQQVQVGFIHFQRVGLAWHMWDTSWAMAASQAARAKHVADDVSSLLSYAKRTKILLV